MHGDGSNTPRVNALFFFFFKKLDCVVFCHLDHSLAPENLTAYT